MNASQLQQDLYDIEKPQPVPVLQEVVDTVIGKPRLVKDEKGTVTRVVPIMTIIRETHPGIGVLEYRLEGFAKVVKQTLHERFPGPSAAPQLITFPKRPMSDWLKPKVAQSDRITG